MQSSLLLKIETQKSLENIDFLDFFYFLGNKEYPVLSCFLLLFRTKWGQNGAGFKKMVQNLPNGATKFLFGKG